MESLLSVRGLTKSFKGNQVLCGIGLMSYQERCSASLDPMGRERARPSTSSRQPLRLTRGRFVLGGSPSRATCAPTSSSSGSFPKLIAGDDGYEHRLVVVRGHDWRVLAVAGPAVCRADLVAPVGEVVPHDALARGDEPLLGHCCVALCLLGHGDLPGTWEGPLPSLAQRAARPARRGGAPLRAWRGADQSRGPSGSGKRCLLPVPASWARDGLEVSARGRPPLSRRPGAFGDREDRGCRRCPRRSGCRKGTSGPMSPHSRRSVGTDLQLTKRLARTVRMTLPRREAASRMGVRLGRLGELP